MVEWLWPSFCDMYSPWLVPYFPHNMKQLPANWIMRISNNEILLPWSELYSDKAQLMMNSFIECVQFLLDTLPNSECIIGNLFYWYEIHYGVATIPRHVLTPVHKSLMLLPWNQFQPNPVHIDCIHRSLNTVNCY